MLFSSFHKRKIDILSNSAQGDIYVRSEKTTVTYCPEDAQKRSLWSLKNNGDGTYSIQGRKDQCLNTNRLIDDQGKKQCLCIEKCTDKMKWSIRDLDPISQEEPQPVPNREEKPPRKVKKPKPDEEKEPVGREQEPEPSSESSEEVPREKQKPITIYDIKKLIKDLRKQYAPKPKPKSLVEPPEEKKEEPEPPEKISKMALTPEELNDGAKNKKTLKEFIDSHRPPYSNLKKPYDKLNDEKVQKKYDDQKKKNLDDTIADSLKNLNEEPEMCEKYRQFLENQKNNNSNYPNMNSGLMNEGPSTDEESDAD